MVTIRDATPAYILAIEADAVRDSLLIHLNATLISQNHREETDQTGLIHGSVSRRDPVRNGTVLQFTFADPSATIGEQLKERAYDICLKILSHGKRTDPDR